MGHLMRMNSQQCLFDGGWRNMMEQHYCKRRGKYFIVWFVVILTTVWILRSPAQALEYNYPYHDPYLATVKAARRPYFSSSRASEPIPSLALPPIWPGFFMNRVFMLSSCPLP